MSLLYASILVLSQGSTIINPLLLNTIELVGISHYFGNITLL
mgnify:CR=1 FL=1